MNSFKTTTGEILSKAFKAFAGPEIYTDSSGRLAFRKKPRKNTRNGKGVEGGRGSLSLVQGAYTSVLHVLDYAGSSPVEVVESLR